MKGTPRKGFDFDSCLIFLLAVLGIGCCAWNLDLVSGGVSWDFQSSRL